MELKLNICKVVLIEYHTQNHTNNIFGVFNLQVLFFPVQAIGYYFVHAVITKCYHFVYGLRLQQTVQNPISDNTNVLLNICPSLGKYYSYRLPLVL